MANVTRLLKSLVFTELEQFESFLDYMPNPDIFFEQTGETLEVYNRMLIDDEIGASLDVRKRTLLSYPYAVTAGADDNLAAKVQQFVSEALKRINVTRLVEQMQTALEFGYSVNELIWANPKDNNGEWHVRETMLIKPERFGFDQRGDLILINTHQKLDATYKFIVHRHGITAENPYGLSILRRCYWPWTFKKAGWRFWLIAAEKFGVPTVLALFECQDEDEARQRAQTLAGMLSGIQTDAALAVANVKSIETIESSKGIEGFKTLIEMCNKAISKAITGQVLASGEAQYGTRAQASVHEKILYGVVDSDARAIADTINQTLIPWLVELNFGKGAPFPLFEFDLAEETPWERIKEAIDRGIPLSKRALYQRYGLPEPEADEDVFLIEQRGKEAQQPMGRDPASQQQFADGDSDFFSQAPRQRTYLNIW